VWHVNLAVALASHSERGHVTLYNCAFGRVVVAVEYATRHTPTLFSSFLLLLLLLFVLLRFFYQPVVFLILLLFYKAHLRDFLSLTSGIYIEREREEIMTEKRRSDRRKTNTSSNTAQGRWCNRVDASPQCVYCVVGCTCLVMGKGVVDTHFIIM
jgi:hypothetical protein